MYIITVRFVIDTAHTKEFLHVVNEQAVNSLKLEEDCHVFTVAVAESNTNEIFLYEEYTDRAAFDAHLDSDHFATFNELAMPWIIDKQVSSWLKQ